MNNVSKQINIFLDECNLIFKTYHTRTDGYMGTELYIDETKKLYILRGNNFNQPSFPKGYIFAKVDKITGDIYSQSGKVSKGNIFSKFNGIECINVFGVIVNKPQIIERIKELQLKEDKLDDLFDNISKLNI